MQKTIIIFFWIICLSGIFSCDDPILNQADAIQMISAKLGTNTILGSDPVQNAPELVLVFSKAINESSVKEAIVLKRENEAIEYTFQSTDLDKIITITPQEAFAEGESYELAVKSSLAAQDGAKFPGIEANFQIEKDALQITSLTFLGEELSVSKNNHGIALTPNFLLSLSHDITAEAIESEVIFVGDKTVDITVSKLAEKEFKIELAEELSPLTKYNILFSGTLGSSIDRGFELKSYPLFTSVSETPVFPVVSDEELLTLVQEQTFKYFWDFAHPVSGLARERNTSGDLVTSGGSGFGLMSIIVGVERGFVSRTEAVQRWQKIVDFLETADRFHGAWSHWLNGSTGKVIPFSADDDGGDLVETAFLVQGLLTVKEYLNVADPTEMALISKITELWEEVEWSWYQQNDQDVLYWHWSPNFGWQKNHSIRGHNETQIVYILAAASPTFGIDKDVYTIGYARNGDMINGNSYYGIELPVGFSKGGPLFFSHYSYLGLDPRNLEDDYANYWTQNVNHSRINLEHCIDNPNDFVGYDENCWGLTASDNHEGYNAHSPTNDLGVITLTAAISSIPYTPDESMAAIRHFYYYLGNRLWGEYGFYDAFNPTEGWWADSYLAIDQGPIICMIENHRTGLLWELFMSSQEVKDGLEILDFSY